jgi:hypothetical protein
MHVLLALLAASTSGAAAVVAEKPQHPACPCTGHKGRTFCPCDPTPGQCDTGLLTLQGLTYFTAVQLPPCRGRVA